ncbi:MAG: aminoacyl-tRNA hydrolase [Bdellovibrionales bacterium]|nr:aminoacyl-tRNA hydrolase [Bdellovibrionales bacterium]
MWLVVGLGNPGPKYAGTRHNIGFMVLDRWAQKSNISSEKDEHKSKTARIKVGDEDVLIAKPLTFMNLSGEAVAKLLSFYKIPVEKMIVIHDEMDLDFGSIKIQKNRGPAGNNGLKSINQCLGTQDYARVRFGVNSPRPPQMDLADFVLQRFSPEQENDLDKLMDHAIDAAISFVKFGFEKTASQYSRKVLELT